MSRLASAPLLAAIGFGVVASPLLVAGQALALDARVEAAAASALKKATNDFLTMDYAGGIARLDRAARACGATKCAPATKAAVLRDLGTMQFRAGDKPAAAKSFAAAVALQPDLVLNPDYAAPDLRAAWDEATGATGAQPTGDFEHTPVPEQKTNTPIPVFVVSSEESLARVVVKYKGPAAPDWRRLELVKRRPGGWEGLIPCDAATRGTLTYYIQGFDGSGDPVAASGDPKHPFSVAIKDDIAGDEPHLPGKSPPRPCDEGGCEPGAPGCEQPPPKRGETASDEPSSRHEGPAPDQSYASWWFGLSGAVDFVSLPASTDVCKLLANRQPANSSGYYCTNPNGDDFPSRVTGAQNSSLVPGQAGAVTGGVHPGDVRVMLAVDYAISPSILAGVRLGAVSNAYPGNAAAADGRAFSSRVHLEVRGTYLFGHEPLANRGFSPMLFAGTGAAEVDGHTTTLVSQQNIAGQQPVVAWVTSGPLFLAVGGGMRYQFSRRTAFTAAVRVSAAFGGVGALLTYGPEIAFQYGF